MGKLRLQKYLAEIPAAFSGSSNVSFLILANHMVLKSVTIKDIILNWTASTNSGMGKTLLPLKYWAYCRLCPLQSPQGTFSLAVPTRRLALMALFVLAE